MRSTFNTAIKYWQKVAVRKEGFCGTRWGQELNGPAAMELYHDSLCYSGEQLISDIQYK